MKLGFSSNQELPELGSCLWIVGSKKDFDKAVSVKELASSIATSLGKAAVGAKINGVMKPLDYIV